MHTSYVESESYSVYALVYTCAEFNHIKLQILITCMYMFGLHGSLKSSAVVFLGGAGPEPNTYQENRL